MSQVLTPECHADELASWAALAPLTEGILTPFGVIDPARLSQSGHLDALVGLARLRSWVDAQEMRIMADAARRPDPVPAVRRELSEVDEREREQWARESLVQEIACALRLPPTTAKSRMHSAEVLCERLPATLESLEAGSISVLHARSLVDAVRDLDDTVTGRLEARVLPRAATQTVGEFRSAIRRGVARLDPRAADEKHAASAQDRRVAYEPDAHAMAWLNAYLPAADAQRS